MKVKLTIEAETDDVLGLKERIAYALERVDGIRHIQVPDVRVIQEEIKSWNRQQRPIWGN